MLVEDAAEVALVPGDVAQAQDGAPAGGAPIGLDVAAGLGLRADVERPALGEQGVERRLERVRGVRLEPDAEKAARPASPAGRARRPV